MEALMIRLTRDQVREVDRQAVDDYHIPSIVLMENAARSFVDAIEDLLSDQLSPIAILCGGGNNGGDGFAIARHLHNRGHPVSIVLAIPPAKLKGDALTNWKIVERMKIPAECAGIFENATGIHILRESKLVIDALFGTGLNRAIPSEMEPYIEACNSSDPMLAREVISVDVPSGLDCDTGEPLGACVRATRTITFAAEKVGFANPLAHPFLGTVLVGDIGSPRELIEQIAGLGGKSGSGLS